MKVLLILVLIVVCLALIGQLRIGVQVVYAVSGLTLRLKLGPFKIGLLPRSPQKAGKRRKRKKDTRAAQSKQGIDMLGQIKRALPLVTEAAGRLKRKVCLEHIYLDVTAAATNPASAALAFGGANAAIGMIWPLVEQNFKVKDRCIRTDIDFEASHPTVNLDAAATMTIGQALALALWLAPKLPQVLGTGLQREKRTDTVQKEAV